MQIMFVFCIIQFLAYYMVQNENIHQPRASQSGMFYLASTVYVKKKIKYYSFSHLNFLNILFICLHLQCHKSWVKEELLGYQFSSIIQV